MIIVEPLKLLPDPSLNISPSAPKLLAEQFLEQAEKHPDNTAIFQYGKGCTYRELRHRAETIAHFLLFKNLQRGDVIAIHGSRSIGFVTSMLGVMLAGGAFLPIDSALPLQRKKLKLKKATARRIILLSSPDFVSIDLADEMPSLNIDAATGEIQEQYQREWTTCDTVLPKVQSDDSAYVFFTSGTTGKPKGIIGIQKSLAHFINWQRKTFGINATDRCAHLTAVSFDVVLRDIFLPLSSGAVLYIPDTLDMQPVKVFHWLKEEQITTFHIVPTLAQFWLDYAPKNLSLPSLRWIFFAGEPLSNQLVSRWKHILSDDCELVNLYGPTETCLAKCFYLLSEGIHEGIQPVGRPLPYTQALVLSENNRLCGIGELGEIVIRTPFRTHGYLPNCKIKNCFVTNPFTEDPDDLLYYTGDIGRYHPSGVLEILGRIDDQIKINGIRIEPAEITALLSRHPEVQSCIVLPIRLEGCTPYLAAYVVSLHSKTEAEYQDELKTFLTEQLPSAFIPSVFVFMEKLPRKQNGKVDRDVLPTPHQQMERGRKIELTPRNLAERRLVAVWETILNKQPIGRDDNFFDLGGDSLQALHLIAEIERQFGLIFPLPVLFEAPIVEQLAKRISNAVVSTDPCVSLKPEGQNPPLFCISGTGGHVFRLRPLALYLDTNQPVYGLHYPGADGKQKPFDRIEDIVPTFIKMMREKQTHGPYYLCGYSFGGLVCYEIAQQLAAEGEKVALIALLDTSPQLEPASDYNEELVAILDKKPEEDTQDEEEEIFVLEHLRLLVSQNETAEKAYRPEPYTQCKIALFRTNQSYEMHNKKLDLGWGSFVSQDCFSVHPVPGTHASMVEEPHVEVLAKAMDRAIKNCLN